MTVKQLIKELEKYDQNARVITNEGDLFSVDFGLGAVQLIPSWNRKELLKQSKRNIKYWAVPLIGYSYVKAQTAEEAIENAKDYYSLYSEYNYGVPEEIAEMPIDIE